MVARTKSGNVAGILDETGKKTEYAYDEANRVKKVTDNGSLLVTYGYHADNTLAQARFANGITTEYTYDKDKNPASITTTTRTGEKLFAYRYAYDYNGNRIVKQDVRELTSGDLQRVGDYGRIGETGGQAGGLLGKQSKPPQATRYRYDPLQRIAGVSYADGREESLAYDSAGNRALRKYGAIEEAYQYDSRNRLTEVIRKDNERAENNRITSYQYDNQGNTLQEETRGYTEGLLQNSRYEYDGFNKTRKVTVENFGNETDLPTATQIQENFYDAENLRYGITENGARTNFITNGWKVLAEQDESNQTTNRIVLGYGIIASDSLKPEGDGYQYFHWNEHGDTEFITGEDGQVRNSYGYDAFGSLTTAEEIVRNRYTYNGEQYDAITSQYYLRARFYNPQVARFTQEDVYRGDGLNLYAYCAINPVMYVDPSGYSYTFPSNILDRDIYTDVSDYVDPGRLDIDKATIKRNTPGIATGNFTNSIPIEGTKIRSSDFSSIAIPKEVAANVVGKEYKNFNELRQAIYKEIANSKYASEFTPSNVKLMKDGLAPFAPKTLYSQRFGKKYNIDHAIEIQDGGYVYDLDNLSIIAPKTHEEKTKEEEKRRKSKCEIG